MNLKISKTNDYFELEGEKNFYLADTVWGAFTNITMEEWEGYLDIRSSQGFNVLQINILRQWDVADDSIIRHPFEIKTDGSYDFYRMNESYFENARQMLKLAKAKGFIPALVILWGSYVPDTWMSKQNFGCVMPLDVVKPYTEYIVKVFSDFNPIYFVSGDTDTGSDMTVKYYTEAAKTVRQLSPEALITMHIWGDGTEIPGEIDKGNLVDFYVYQSGHRIEDQSKTYEYAMKMSSLTDRHPVINSEPCYEGSGFVNKYGRYNEFDIRKSTWQSLLSGAKAGIAYGAHGIWSWHTKGKTTKWGEVLDTCYTWRNALQLKGAWDVSFAKWIFETYDLFDINPRELILNKSEEIRCSVAEDLSKVVIYAPYNTDITVAADLSEHRCTMIVLSDKYFAKPSMSFNAGETTINMSEFNSDVLIICRKR